MQNTERTLLRTSTEGWSILCTVKQGLYWVQQLKLLLKAADRYSCQLVIVSRLPQPLPSRRLAADTGFLSPFARRICMRGS
jgi:hypothetical protein